VSCPHPESWHSAAASRSPRSCHTCDGCTPLATSLSRRAFVAQSTLAAIAAALAGCSADGDENSSGATIPTQPAPILTPIVVTLANFPVLAAIGAAARVSSQPPIALARTPSGLVGYSLSCSHLSTVVNMNDNFTLRCPNHGAEFAFDGTWTGGQQQTSNLARVTVMLSDDGSLATITG
jgi:Rieske Fe-S protein